MTMIFDGTNGVTFPDSSTQITAPTQIGVGQAWVDLTASRASGTTYTNATGKPIMVSITSTRVGSSASVSAVVGGVTVFAADSTGQWYGSNNPCFIVPNNTTYVVTFSGVSIKNWAELR